MNLNVLFCDDPLDSKPAVDPDFGDEFAAARQSDFTTHLVSYETLTRDGDAERATRRVRPSEALQRMIYRGWMLKPNQYASLFEALLAKNYKLINSPTEYQNCHYLPNSYPFISGHTPKTIWLTVENQRVDYEQVFDRLAAFSDLPLIIKDYVKSQKHYWDTACFIPSAADRGKVRAVVEKFMDLQGTDLNEGLVFREFVELQDLAVHSKSKMPLKEEYRLFFLSGHLLGCYDYWEEGDYAASERPPLDAFEVIAKNIPSNFFTMDIARTKTGEWIIIELGDGQVAGLPDKVDRTAFYDLISQHQST